MDQKNMMFSNKKLKDIIVPLFLEQLLVMLVGIADTFIVSYAGEAAVSGVSLVNSFNTIFIYLFTALASGGAVIISQYIGKRETASAGETSSQLLAASVLCSVLTAVFILGIHRPLMGVMFGKVEPEVMKACVVYLKISAYSYPAIAIYSAGAAVYRSIGKTDATMYISVIANIINVAGNIVGVFVLNAGVAGVAYPSLVARIFSAAAITYLCFRGKNPVQYRKQWVFSLNRGILCRVLRIAVPNGIESGIFQLVKVALSSVAALFGTYQIAANGIAQSIWSLAALAGVAMGPVFITVIGQCMGAGDVDAAEYYFKKLLKITVLFSIIWNGLIMAGMPFLMRAYVAEEETKRLVILLVLIHNLFNSIAFPFSGPLSNGLRAAGDVRYTMIVSIASTVAGRFVFSLLFGVVFRMGVMGIAYAMCLDWVVRAAVFYVRFRGGKWKQIRLI